MRQMAIFHFVVNVINLYAILALLIIQIMMDIILLILIDMMLYANYIIIIMLFTVINVKKIYVCIVNMNMNHMIVWQKLLFGIFICVFSII
jgi:hypothetical protein